MGWTYLASWARTLGLSTTNLTKYVCDNLNYLKGLSGPVEIDNDLRILNPANGKGIRFRRSGSALDIDFIGDGASSFDVWFNWGLSAGALSNKLRITKDGLIVGSAKAKCSDGLGLTYKPVILANMNPTAVAGWQTWKILYSLPADCVCVEISMYNGDTLPHSMGVRPKGESQGRLVSVPAGSSCMMLTTVNAEMEIEVASWGSGANKNEWYGLIGYLS